MTGELLGSEGMRFPSQCRLIKRSLVQFVPSHRTAPLRVASGVVALDESARIAPEDGAAGEYLGSASGGGRTRDRSIKSRLLCQLSYRGGTGKLSLPPMVCLLALAVALGVGA